MPKKYDKLQTSNDKLTEFPRYRGDSGFFSSIKRFFSSDKTQEDKLVCEKNEPKTDLPKKPLTDNLSSLTFFKPYDENLAKENAVAGGLKP